MRGARLCRSLLRAATLDTPHSPQVAVLHFRAQLAEEHVETITVVTAQSFLDALPMIFEVSDLELPRLYMDAVGNDTVSLNQPDDFPQNR